MKLNINNEQRPLISSNDVYVDDANTLSDVINKHESEINDLEKNVKWLYKYGGTGSKGGGSGSVVPGSDINLTCNIIFDNQIITNKSSRIILKNSDINSTSFSLGLQRVNGLISYTVSVTHINLLKNQSITLLSNVSLNSDNDYAVSIPSLNVFENGSISIKLRGISSVTGDILDESYLITYVKNPYIIDISLLDNNNNIATIQGTDVYVDTAKTNGLKLRINYTLQSSNKIQFTIDNADIFSITEGYINEDGLGQGTIDIPVLDEFINDQNSIGFNTSTIIFNIPRDASIGQEQKYLTYSLDFNYIPRNDRFFKVSPVKNNAKIYKYTENTYNDAIQNYNKYTKYFNAYNTLLTLSDGQEFDANLRAEIIEELHLNDLGIEITNDVLLSNISNYLDMLNSKFYMFGIGSISLNVTAYNGTETSGTIDILCELSDGNGENSNFINIGIEQIPIRTKQVISFAVHEPGVYKIGIYSNSTQNRIYYYFYVFDKLSGIDWYDSGVEMYLQTYYKSGNVSPSFNNYKNLKYIQQYANNNASTLVDITNELSSLNVSEDIMLSLGIQYSSINNDANKILSISTINRSGESVVFDIYQNCIKLQGLDNDIKIYIPKENNYNVTADDKYHLLTIYKRYIYEAAGNAYYELCVYIDGALEGAAFKFITDGSTWNKITMHPGNYALNLVELTYFKHNETDNVKRLDITGKELSYLDDISIAEYFYKYVNTYKEDKSSIPAFENIKDIMSYLRNFKETEEGMIEVGNDADINNISKSINVPCIEFVFDEVLYNLDFTSVFSKSYDEGLLAKTEFILSDLLYSPGKKELQSVNIPNEISSETKWYIKLQGSSTGLFYSKNLTLGIRYNGPGYMPIFTPNFKYNEDFNLNNKTKEEINNINNAKNSFLPEKAFTLKADCVDSTHSNNTAVGAFVNSNTTPFDIVFDNGATNKNTCVYANYIKNCLLGFPVLGFIKVINGVNTKLYFLGIYNFNLGRDSYFNMGYYSPMILKSQERINNDLKELDGNEFKVTYVSISSEQSADLPISDNVIVAEIQGGNPRYDFSQYNQTILMPQSSSDKGAMFGDFVPTYTPQGNSNKDHQIRTNLQRLVKSVAKAGGYLFENVLGKHLGEYQWKYNKYIEDGVNSSILNSANQVPNYKIQYVRNPNTSDDNLKYVVDNSILSFIDGNDTPILDLSNNTGTVEDLSYLITTKEDISGVPNNPILDYTSCAEYYTVCMAFGLVDSVMKNLNVKTWDSEYKENINDINKGKWYVAFYDMDTSFGRDNEGAPISYFAFSDYWTSSDTILQTATVYRDFYPKSNDEDPYVNGQTFKHLGFDVPSSYLFAIAKYANLGLGDGLNNNAAVGESLETMKYSLPQNIWARWRTISNETIQELGSLGLGELNNANDFIDKYFIRNLDEIPEQIWNINYRFKYLKRIKKGDNDLHYQEAKDVSGTFNKKDYLPFHGKGINELREWLNGRFHILDGYFNLDGTGYKIQKLEYTNKEDAEELTPIKDNNDSIIAWEWHDTKKPIKNANGTFLWTNTNYNESTPAINGGALAGNSDIIILGDIFSSNNEGAQYSNDISLSVKAREYSPLIIRYASGEQKKYLLSNPNNEYNIYERPTGVQNFKFGGSPAWTYVKNLNSIITNGSLNLYSDKLESITLTQGTCHTYNIISMRSLKTVYIERDANDTTSSFTGSLNFIKNAGVDLYPDLTEISLIRTEISLNVNDEGVRRINLTGTNSSSVQILNCKNLENVILTSGSIETCTITPGWNKDILLNNININELHISPKSGETDTSLSISNNNTLTKLHITGFKRIKISNCKLLNEIQIDDIENVESLQIIKCNTVAYVDEFMNSTYHLFNIIDNKGNSISSIETNDLKDKVINLNSFTNLKEISLNGTQGFNIININELSGYQYQCNNNQYNVIRLIGPAFKDTSLRKINSGDLYLLIDVDSNNEQTATFNNSYIGEGGLLGYELHNNFIVSKNVTNLSNLFNNEYIFSQNARKGGITTDDAAIILGNINSSRFKFIYEDIDKITNIDSMFSGQLILCSNREHAIKLSLSKFKNVNNISRIFAHCSNFTYLCKDIFKQGVNIIGSGLLDSEPLVIDTFVTNIDKIEQNVFTPVINKINGLVFSNYYFSSSININNVFSEDGPNNEPTPITNTINIEELLFNGITNNNHITEISGINIGNNINIDWSNLFVNNDEPRFPNLIHLYNTFNHVYNNENPVNNFNVSQIGLKYLTSQSTIDISNSLNIYNEYDPIDYEDIFELNKKLKTIIMSNDSLSLYKSLTKDELINYLEEYDTYIENKKLDYAFNNVILKLNENIESHELILDNNDTYNENNPYDFISMNHAFDNFKVKSLENNIPFIISQKTLRCFNKVTSWDYAFANVTLYKNLPLNMFNLLIDNNANAETKYASSNYYNRINSMKNMFNNVKITNQTWFAHEDYNDLDLSLYNSPLDGSYKYIITTNYKGARLTNPQCKDIRIDGYDTIYGENIINHLILPFDILYGCNSNCKVTECFADSDFEGILPDKLIKDSNINNSSTVLSNIFRNLLVIPNKVMNGNRNYKYNILNSDGTSWKGQWNPIELPTYVFVPSEFITNIYNLSETFNFKILLPDSLKSDNLMSQQVYFIFKYDSINLNNASISLSNTMPGSRQNGFLENIYNQLNENLDIELFNPADYHNIMYGMMLPDVSLLKITYEGLEYNKEDAYGLDREDFGFEYNSSLQLAFDTYGNIFTPILMTLLYGYVVNEYDPIQYTFMNFHINNRLSKISSGEARKPFMSVTNSFVGAEDKAKYGIGKFTVLPILIYNESNKSYKYTVSGFTKYNSIQLTDLNVSPGESKISYENLSIIED